MSGDRDVPHAEDGYSHVTSPTSCVSGVWPSHDQYVAGFFETLDHNIWHVCVPSLFGQQAPLMLQRMLVFTAVFGFQKLPNLLKLTRRVVNR